MSMDYSSGYCDVIKINAVKELTPVNWPKLESLYTEDVSDSCAEDDLLSFLAFVWDPEFHGTFEIGSNVYKEGSIFLLDDEELLEARLEQYREVIIELVKEFGRNTTVDNHNLSLSMYYHDSENNGSSYDEISGGVFTVHDCYLPNPAAADMISNGMITRAHFVNLG